MKKIIVYLSLIIIIILIMLIFLYRNDIAAIWKFITYNKYEYKYFCYKDQANCITVITYSKPILGDNSFKRYIVYGKNKMTLPLKVKHIEYPNDTNMVILWVSEYHCKIVSNLKPLNMSNLSKNLEIEIIDNNIQYEKFADKYPQLNL
ncbi:MAG: hypothetical protein JW807_17610 [Spirochaetes bacterium]|nr:hypothetical protein [Spirochaetota bacterium]